MDGEDHDPHAKGLRRPRRRRTLARIAVGAVTLAGAVATAAALIPGDRDAAPSPGRPSVGGATPSPSPTPGPEPARDEQQRASAVVRDGRLVSYAVNARGSLMTVWQSCRSWTEESACRTAWQLQSHAGVHRGLVRGNFAGAHAAGDYVAVTSWNRRGVVVDDDGRSRPLRAVRSGEVVVGDALVRLGKSLGVVDPVAATYWPLPADGPDGWVDGAITADGTVWATSAHPAPIDVRLSWLAPGATTPTWLHHTFSTTFHDGVSPGPLAVAKEHAAAPSMHDGVDVATYGRFAVTVDGGATWSDLRPSDLPFDNVDAMAATSGGTLYVASLDDHGHDRLFRSTDSSWTRFSEVRGAPEVSQLVQAGDQVVARGGTLDQAEIYRLDDAGHVRHWAAPR
jgi:hypothetical protein